jgi:predicted transcriptional regulator
MSLFHDESNSFGGRAALLSIRPHHAEAILSGLKRVEFRRIWSSYEIAVLVLYSSAPEQKLVGLVYIEQVTKASAEGLWKIGCTYGGGLAQEELQSYLDGRAEAFGIILGNRRRAAKPVDPKVIYPNFVPPQSFRHLTAADYWTSVAAMFPGDTA